MVEDSELGVSGVSPAAPPVGTKFRWPPAAGIAIVAVVAALVVRDGGGWMARICLDHGAMVPVDAAAWAESWRMLVGTIAAVAVLAAVASLLAPRLPPVCCGDLLATARLRELDISTTAALRRALAAVATLAQACRLATTRVAEVELLARSGPVRRLRREWRAVRKRFGLSRRRGGQAALQRGPSGPIGRLDLQRRHRARQGSARLRRAAARALVAGRDALREAGCRAELPDGAWAGNAGADRASHRAPADERLTTAALSHCSTDGGGGWFGN
jgi:hypothetical protein